MAFNLMSTIDLYQGRKSAKHIWVFAFVYFTVTVSLVSSALGSDISGPARVVDGDTLEIGSNRIRIHGIDAPETRQTCLRNNAEWLCGAGATQALRTMTQNNFVSCIARSTDRYGRIVGMCSVDGMDVGEALVKMGLALAYRKYSSDYVGAESSAKADRIGVWAGLFVKPWDWRRGKRLSQKFTKESADCKIKGNISRSGERIYHVPSGRYYGRTNINESKGERWFCSESEAVNTGWRKSLR